MGGVTALIFDDELENERGAEVVRVARTIEAEYPGSSIVTYFRADQLIDHLLSERVRPDVAVVDILSNHDTGLRQNVIDAFGRCNLEAVLDEAVLGAHGFGDWITNYNWGIGLLAVLKLTGCEHRLALTNHQGVGDLVTVLSALRLVTNGDVCLKGRDYSVSRIRQAMDSVLRAREDGHIAPERYRIEVAETSMDRRWITGIKVVRLEDNRKTDVILLSGRQKCRVFTCLAHRGTKGSLPTDIKKQIDVLEGAARMVPATSFEALSVFKALAGIDDSKEWLSGGRCSFENLDWCAWQTQGRVPASREVEGHHCYEVTAALVPGGYCPKTISLGRARQRGTAPQTLTVSGVNNQWRYLRDPEGEVATGMRNAFGTTAEPLWEWRDVGRGVRYAIAGVLDTSSIWQPTNPSNRVFGQPDDVG